MTDAHGTSDPQTAADAAERVQRWLDAVREHGRRDTGYPDEDDVDALLEDRKRMVVELEQVRNSARVLGLENGALRGTLSRVRKEREQLLTTTERQRAELEQVRGCHDTLHDKNTALHELVAELTDARVSKQWRLIAPSGNWQVLPRETVEGGMPWPDGWTVETRNVRFGPWLPQGAETTATRPADGLDGTGEGPTLPTPAQGPQRPAQGDDAEPTP